MQVKIPLLVILLGLLCVSAIPSYAQTDGAGAKTSNVEAWKDKIATQLVSKRAFPPGTAGQGGTAKVVFVINRQGKLISSSLEESSGSKLLDTAALTTVERAEPFPGPPAEVTDVRFSFTVSFTVQSLTLMDGPNIQTSNVKAWTNKIVTQVASKGAFPPGATDQSGTATVMFVIDRQGKLISRTLAESSGSKLLDAAALTTVERAEPFPEPPAEVPDDKLRFTVPLTFAGRKQLPWAGGQWPEGWVKEQEKINAKIYGICRGC